MDLLTTKQQLRLYFLLPLILSLAGAVLRFWPLFLLAAAAVFVMTAFLPACAGREGLWVFLTSFVACIPVNVMLISMLKRDWITDGIVETWLDGALWIALILLTMMSVEEIVMAILSRLFWPVQEDDKTLLEWVEREKQHRGERRQK